MPLDLCLLLFTAHYHSIFASVVQIAETRSDTRRAFHACTGSEDQVSEGLSETRLDGHTRPCGVNRLIRQAVSFRSVDQSPLYRINSIQINSYLIIITWKAEQIEQFTDIMQSVIMGSVWYLLCQYNPANGPIQPNRIIQSLRLSCY